MREYLAEASKESAAPATLARKPAGSGSSTDVGHAPTSAQAMPALAARAGGMGSAGNKTLNAMLRDPVAARAGGGGGGEGAGQAAEVLARGPRVRPGRPALRQRAAQRDPPAGRSPQCTNISGRLDPSSGSATRGPRLDTVTRWTARFPERRCQHQVGVGVSLEHRSALDAGRGASRAVPPDPGVHPTGWRGPHRERGPPRGSPACPGVLLKAEPRRGARQTAGSPPRETLLATATCPEKPHRAGAARRTPIFPAGWTIERLSDSCSPTRHRDPVDRLLP